jgi:Fic family protein
MRIFSFSRPDFLTFPPDVVSQIACIHEYKGKQDLFLEADRDSLSVLLDVAKIQSTRASNAIENIHAPVKRIEALVRRKTEPQNRSEQEISGYRDVLNTIHQNYDHIPVSRNIILELHRDLYSYTGQGYGGKFKMADNIIAETEDNRISRIRFKPLSAFEIPDAVAALCDAWNESRTTQLYDQLVLIPCFILDFLCIHPFDDGNGRISRLLTLLLLYQSDYIVGKYISIEMLIENDKKSYYDTLEACSSGWCEGKNEYMPFIRYYLGILIKAYREFENRVTGLYTDRKLSKEARIRHVFETQLGALTKRQILELCPDISTTTVERTLKSLLDAEIIGKTGAGPRTAYFKKEGIFI